MTLHNPHTVATPSQRLEEAAHQARLARMAARARLPAPTICPIAEPIEVRPEPVFDVGQWVERQKETWFSIESEIEPPEAPRPKVEDIQRAVSLHYEVSRADIVSARRTADIVRPRQVAMYLSKKLTHRSLPEIGRRFGQRDHTTVLHGVRKIEHLIPKDEKLAADITAIMSHFTRAV